MKHINYFKFPKVISPILCVSLILGNCLPAFALTNFDQTASEDGSQAVEVLYNQSSTFFVTIPKSITLDSNKASAYSVKVEGDISSDREVYVSPIDCITSTSDFDFYMKDKSIKNPKDDVVATISQSKFNWNFEDVVGAYKETNNNIIASDLTSGTWSGTFDFTINMHQIISTSGLSISTDGDVIMGANDAVQINAYLDGEVANDTVTWTSSNPNITVTNGQVSTTASAGVGDTATITVSAPTTEIALIDKVLSDMGMVVVASAAEDTSIEFQVKIIDIKYSIDGIYLNPGQNIDITATILPEGTTGIVTWTRTATSGMNLVKNNNTVNVSIASDMPVGSSYQLIATFGEFSKTLNVNIVGETEPEPEPISDYTLSFNSQGGTGASDITVTNGNTYGTLPTSSQDGYTFLGWYTSATNGTKVSNTDVVNLTSNTTLYAQWEETTTAGLYDANGTLTKTWSELISDGTLKITNGVLISKYTTTGNASSTNLSGKLVIDDSVTSLGENALRQCTNLTEITIPNTVTNLGTFSFSGCTNLINIQIPNSVTSIGDAIFGSCTSLTNVTIPNSVTSMGVGTFGSCTSLTEVTLPDSITNIPTSTFISCTKLTDVTLPSNITTIHNQAFNNCKSLTSIDIPDNVTYIGDFAFLSSGLTSITLPNSELTLGKLVFQGSISLKEVIIQNNIKMESQTTYLSSGYHPFYKCSALTNVYITSNVTSISVPNAHYSLFAWTISPKNNVIHIYSEASSLPSGFNTYWNANTYVYNTSTKAFSSVSYVPVTYGITPEVYASTYK